jgi:hypothetical protein
MDFNLTEEQLMIQAAARDFAKNSCLPGVIETKSNHFLKNKLCN